MSNEIQERVTPHQDRTAIRYANETEELGYAVERARGSFVEGGSVFDKTFVLEFYSEPFILVQPLKESEHGNFAVIASTRPRWLDDEGRLIGAAANE